MKRIQYIDSSKAIAILLMLFAHTLSGTGVIRTYIASFHMQVFFIVSGLLLSKRYGGQLQLEDYHSIFLRKLRQLFIPYVVFCLLLAAMYLLLELVAGEPLHPLYYLKRIVFLQGIDSLWFIPVFFIAEALMLTLMLKKWGKIVSAAISIFAILLFSVFPDRIPENDIARMFIKCLVGFVFIVLGAAIDKSCLIKKTPIWVSLIALVTGAVLSHINGFAAMGSLEVGRSGLLFFLNAVLSGFALIRICEWIGDKAQFKWKWASYIGQNTMVILCTNNLLIELIRLADHKLTGDSLLRLKLAGSFILFIVLLAIEILLIYLFQGRLGVLVGKSPLKSKKVKGS